ncbi:uncharacterized protein N7458_004330 [Penicillium daleae]|uniref:Uncharacterized protein n=1 Tax=Penicillium daleae TaxID=63821 RepID=A0AAD6G4W1_9EURO|nr:uncharacterized protein N7458_004330 [Penicillium daleae]KAJ5456066.1 hypothetical protein N7458_004330 [Penicillium daleae]
MSKINNTHDTTYEFQSTKASQINYEPKDPPLRLVAGDDGGHANNSHIFLLDYARVVRQAQNVSFPESLPKEGWCWAQASSLSSPFLHERPPGEELTESKIEMETGKLSGPMSNSASATRDAFESLAKLESVAAPFASKSKSDGGGHKAISHQKEAHLPVLPVQPSQ